jgi:hypothetical protein
MPLLLCEPVVGILIEVLKHVSEVSIFKSGIVIDLQERSKLDPPSFILFSWPEYLGYVAKGNHETLQKKIWTI